jgi:hypothetical protein
VTQNNLELMRTLDDSWNAAVGTTPWRTGRAEMVRISISRISM